MLNLEKIKEQKTTTELLQFSIINLDKPSGPTSFQVAETVGKMLNAKFSHFGTLDPKVTGVLPIAINRACRLATWFMRKDKEYVGIMRVHKETSEEKLKEEIKNFIGKIMQLPPVKSRVKREERQREVYSFDILEIKGKDVLFKTKVEAGTYIRKICHDIGLKIGGAHMAELRRTQAGIFSEYDENFVSLYELEKVVEEYKGGNDKNLRELLIPGEVVGKILPIVQVSEKSIRQLLTGKPVFKQDLIDNVDIEIGKSIAVFCGNKFIEIAKVVNEREIFAKSEFVLN